MKKLVIGVLLLILFWPTNVLAHMVGQPPFFKINGEYSELYPVPTSSATNFDLPQDIAKKNYLVGESLQMEMDVDQLPILPEIIEQTQFRWEFGDGANAEGLKNNHVYSKPGSYFMHIMAKYRNDEPQLIQSTLINILKDPNYQLPMAKLRVNGKESKDPLTDIIQVDFNQIVRFDSSGSSAKDGVVEYLWDFGDGQTSKEPNPTHTYDRESMQVFPVLRVKDKNGFIHDTYVQLEQSDTSSSLSDISSDFTSWPLLLIGLIVIIGFVGLFIVRKKILK